jgi:hypothetical protein
MIICVPGTYNWRHISIILWVATEELIKIRLVNINKLLMVQE